MPGFRGAMKEIEMDIAGIAKSHQTNSTAAGKTSSKKSWKLTDSLREKITEYAREDAEQNVYMGNKFLTLRKSEVAKVAPDRAALMGKLSQYTADMKEIREAAYYDAFHAARQEINSGMEVQGGFDARA